MTSNAKWGVNSPLPSENEEPAPFGSDNPYWFPYDASEVETPAQREHDPDAKALLNRHLAALQGNTRKQGNSALHDLESKLAALSETDSAETSAYAEAESAFAEKEPSFVEQANLNDRLRELSNYLNEDLSRIESRGVQPATPEPVETVFGNSLASEPVIDHDDEPRFRHSHKTISAPILDRAWFEDRFAAMRSSIDDIAEQVPDKRVEKLGDQFHQLMEKLDAIHADRSRAAVESGLKQLANYLEENRNWTVSHDNRINQLEERLDHLGRLVSQSNAALTATAKGLEIVARGTGPALAAKTADLVTERLETRLSRLATGDRVTQLSGEVSKLMLQSQHFARKTDDRLKLLQTSLDDGLNQMEDVGQTVVETKNPDDWVDEAVDADTYQPPYADKLSAAQRAAQFAAEHDDREFPEDGEPIRHQIPYGEFLPDEERSNSHMGLIIAAIILLLASAAMLYLNLKDSGAARLLSNAQRTQYQLNPARTDAAQPVRIVLTKADASPLQGSAAPVLSMPLTVPDADAIQLAAIEQDEDGNERQAAILGDTTAQYSIAESYLRETRNESRDDATERLSKAARWFRRAADGGHVPSQYRMATLYELGHGVPQDYTEAMRWYEKAATGGHTKAMHNLAVLTISAGSPKSDYAKAAFWFSKAAESGLRDSQYNLAILNENGLGVKKSIRGALRWYSAAALQGDAKAAQKRDELLRAHPVQGQAIAIGAPKAAKWTTITASVVGGENKKRNPDKPLPEPKAVLKQPVTKPARGEGGWSAQLTHINDTVVKAQEMLIRLGFQPGKADGILGPRTMAAIRAYQEKVGMTLTGGLSDALVNRMQAELAS